MGADPEALHQSSRAAANRKPKPALAIGEVARRSGLAPSAIRYYEAEGLIPEPARVGGKRRYASDVLDRLAIIRTFQLTGFDLKEIGVLLAGIDGGQSVADQLQTLAAKKLPEVEEALTRLELSRRILQAVTACCCPDLSTCAAHIRSAGFSTSTDPAPSVEPEAGAGEEA